MVAALAHRRVEVAATSAPWLTAPAAAAVARGRWPPVEARHRQRTLQPQEAAGAEGPGWAGCLLEAATAHPAPAQAVRWRQQLASAQGWAAAAALRRVTQAEAGWVAL